MEKEERRQRTEGGEDEGERAREEMRRASCKINLIFMVCVFTCLIGLQVSHHTIDY